MLFRFLTTPAITVPSSAPLQKAAWLMQECEGRQLPVMRDGHPIGVVTAEDLADEGELRDGHWLHWGTVHTVGELCKPAPIMKSPKLDDVLLALLEHAAVLVVDGDSQLLGVVTEHDGVRAALERVPFDHPALSVASAPVRTVAFDDRACNALQRMRWHDTRHVVLVDAEGQALGVISRRDLVAEGVHRGRSMAAGGVWRERPLIALPDGAPLREAADLLVEERVGLVPLLDAEKRPIAVVTRRDLIRFALGSRDERRASREGFRKGAK